MKYQIYDGRNPRILDNHETEVEAPNARKALQQYLNSQGLAHIEFRNTSDNDVVWKTTPFTVENGVKYRVGRVSWWGIKPTRFKES